MILFWFLMAIFILVCIVICFLVLIQSDKGGGISGAIGGGLGGANSLLGTQDTANILTRGTVIFGGVFFVLCILMSFLMSHQSVNVEKSLLQKRAEKQNSFSPASVLNNGGGGLPIRQSGAAMPVQQSATQQQPTQQKATTQTIPVGSLPVTSGKAQASPEK